MNNSHLIKKAILSEKTYKQMESGLYTFLVDSKATKEEIAKVISKQFSCDVEGVRVMSKAAKTKRIIKTRKTVKTGAGKKAIVRLKKGQHIALLAAKTDKSKSKKTKSEKENKRVTKSETIKPIDADGTKRKGLLARFKKDKKEESK
ncbi:50S ribosomal protein L23 [Candidatus Curtissbacteria bacterium RBG_13_35_7]|uniref:Large ribosomal subunit protein uL23 n=1 Tax=Candidatus Curtissbacteria bacterium RBG_13_35_7 TaxID=1797705 RepID=A0A1F5G0V0_9BACT|nr:MAG: 50S ribosomal protein L23 [Candidatus Curtissbacteria bacterium RBG_13_35_7]